MPSTLKTLVATSLAALGLAAPAAAAAPERLVRFDAPLTASAQRALVERSGGEVTRDLRLIDALGARLSTAEAARLDADPRVTVQDNAPVATSAAPDPQELATSFDHAVAVDEVWSANGYGATGKGVTVAVLDTGIAGDLPDFRRSQADGSSRVIASVVTNPDATHAGDGFGHGTHVAGLIAGNAFNRAGDDRQFGRYAGSAPDADLVSIKVSDDEGHATVLDVIHGLQFAVDHRDDLGIRVVNLSLNATAAWPYREDPLDAAVEQAWLQGLVVVAAAGNRGEAADAVHYAPANDPYALTVGASDDLGTRTGRDDVLAAWSSRGRTQDGFAKPEVVAPGARLVGPLAPGALLAQECPSCVTGGGDYLRLGGTSMSAAVTSGVAAVLLEAHPHWTPDMVKAAIAGTARPIAGDGRQLDARAALRAYAGSHTVADANVGLEPSLLIDPATGTIDWAKASWSKASWSDAVDSLKASWSKASWSCAGCFSVSDPIDPAKASWSKASWSKASWSFATTL